MEKHFVIHRWQVETLEKLKNADSYMKVFNALCDYEFDNCIPDYTQFTDEEAEVLSEVLNA
jgi:hypothetical protein